MSEASPTTSSTSLPSPSEGDQADESGSLRGFVWSPDGVVAEINDLDVLQRAHRDPETRVWIDVEGASEATLSAIAKCLGLHPLTAEDIIERNQRAKIEYTAGTMHLVLFALLYEGEVISAELDIVLGTDFLLTSHPPEWRPVDAPNVARNGVAHYLGIGVDHALWAVVDAAVDGYFPVFDKLGDEIDDLQDQVLNRPNRWLIERLFQLRRDLLQIRHAVSPEREVFNQLTNRENPLIHPDRIIYFRDVYDHLIRLTDELDSYREMVSTTLEAYLSSVNNSLSEVMKRLTAVTAVLAGAGALAGIFGMSEAGLALSLEDLRFWLVTGIIGIVSFLGFVYFRRIGYV